MDTPKRKPRLAIWCPSCEVFSLIAESKFTNYCPKCGEQLQERRCIRCGHKWRPRSSKLAEVCPNPSCKSPYWDKEKVMKGRK